MWKEFLKGFALFYALIFYMIFWWLFAYWVCWREDVLRLISSGELENFLRFAAVITFPAGILFGVVMSEIKLEGKS